VHHLVVDGVSWRTILDDFGELYEQLTAGEPAKLRAKSTSYKAWSERIAEYRESDEIAQEKAYWLDLAAQQVPSLPIDKVAENLEGDQTMVSVSLDETATQALLQQVPAVYNTQINDILLTAMTMAFAQMTGELKLLFGMEGHGREDLFEDMDLSRSIGWFTTIYPIVLSLPESKEAGASIKSVKEQLRSIPSNGLGYGVLRYPQQPDETAQILRDAPQAQILFNYLGQFDQVLSQDGLFTGASESSGTQHAPEQHRAYVLDIIGSVGGGKLRFNCNFSAAQYNTETIERLMQGMIEALTKLIEHCLSDQSGGFTPSDFSGAGLDQQELDDVVDELEGLDDDDDFDDDDFDDDFDDYD
ncbi:MAG: condensation domain-containing protein, partial [Psychrosphaera sp.]|nr:condensation domain-containing protein [Psychrosphaera sp.]